MPLRGICPRAGEHSEAEHGHKHLTEHSTNARCYIVPVASSTITDYPWLLLKYFFIEPVDVSVC